VTRVVTPTERLRPEPATAVAAWAATDTVAAYLRGCPFTEETAAALDALTALRAALRRLEDQASAH